MLGREEFFKLARSSKSCNYTTEQLYGAYEAYLTCPRSPFREENRGSSIDCIRCGNCCRRPWRVEVDLHDVLRWIDEGHYDLLETLECRPWDQGDVPDSDSIIIRQLAARIAGEDEDRLATALSIASSVAGSEGSYVLPQNMGCRYLIDGDLASCSIHDIRPEVCRRFPGIR